MLWASFISLFWLSSAPAVDVQHIPPAPAAALQLASPPGTTIEEPAKPDPRDTHTSALITQLGRTVLALIVVVLLILLISKISVSKLKWLRTPNGTDPKLKLVEKLPLDPKHTLYLIETKDHGTVLLGSSEHNLSLLVHSRTRTSGDAKPTTGGTHFAQLMGDTASSSTTPSTPATAPDHAANTQA